MVRYSSFGLQRFGIASYVGLIVGIVLGAPVQADGEPMCEVIDQFLTASQREFSPLRGSVVVQDQNIEIYQSTLVTPGATQCEISVMPSSSVATLECRWEYSRFVDFAELKGEGEALWNGVSTCVKASRSIAGARWRPDAPAVTGSKYSASIRTGSLAAAGGSELVVGVKTEKASDGPSYISLEFFRVAAR